MLLVVDNGSVYTKSIIQFLEETGIKFSHLRFDEISLQNLDQFSSVILSGRRRNNHDMNATNSTIIRHSLETKKPLLGICYGAEILALTIGGTITRMEAPRQGIYEVSVTKDNPLCSGKLNVFESHWYKIAKLDGSFVKLAGSTSCEFEIFQLDGYNIFGTQFHPEMNDDGRNLLGRFVSLDHTLRTVNMQN